MKIAAAGICAVLLISFPTVVLSCFLKDSQNKNATAISESTMDAEILIAAENKILRVSTGENQWEGIRISGNNLKLEMGKTYVFSFRVYTPTVREGSVGIIFQANTDNGWNWKAIAIAEASSLQPAGWHEMSGALDMGESPANVTGLPTLVLTKLVDGRVYDNQTAIFFIDDFTVTDALSGETIFSEDFQSTRTLFENNGGVLLLTSESAIAEMAKGRVRSEHALNVTPLKEIYKDFFLIGSTIDPGNLADSTREREFYSVLKHHYNALTFGNDMKPDAVWQDVSGSYERPPVPTGRLAEVNGWLKTLTGDGFKIIGHTLVWHGQSPNWLNLANGERDKNTAVYKTYTQARENMETYISTVAGYYKNIYSWDVINEAVRKNPLHPATTDDWGYHTLGAIWPSTWDSPWYKAYANQTPQGANPWDYVYDAFYFARKASPSAILYYNDYNMEDPEKVTMVVNIVNAVNLMWARSDSNTLSSGNFNSVGEYIASGGRLLIEGIGLQQHDTIGADVHFQRVENAIQAYIATGAKISITELDVGVPGYQRGDVLSAEDELKQALHYASLFEIFKRYSDSIERVSFWGLQDSRSWRTDELCLVFDVDLRAKLSYYAIADPEGFIKSRTR